MRRYRFLLSALVVVGSLAVTIVAADLVLRAVGYAPTLSHGWLLLSDRQPDDHVITIAPRFLTEAFYDLPDGRATIVTLGDSFTAGHPVAKDDSYPAALVRRLAETAWNVNAVNVGLGDTGPDQQLRLLKQYVLPRLRPDIVVWAFYANDVGDNIRQAVYDIEADGLVPLDASEHWLNVRQRWFHAIPLPSSIKVSSPLLGFVFKTLEIRGRDSRPEARAWSVAKIRLAIAELERLAIAHGFETYYVLIAPQSLYLANADPADPASWDSEGYATLHEILAERRDLINAWFTGSGVRAGEIFADEERDRNRLGDRHFNEAGYSMLADAIAKRLRQDRSTVASE